MAVLHLNGYSPDYGDVNKKAIEQLLAEGKQSLDKHQGEYLANEDLNRFCGDLPKEPHLDDLAVAWAVIG